MNDQLIMNNKRDISSSRKKIHDIHERIYKFVIRLIKFTQKIPKNPQNLVIIPQVVASATSMGANDREADGAMSRKQFVNSYVIVRKEGKETHYWLRVICDTNSLTLREEGNELMKECQEIVLIVSTIILNSKLKN